MRRLSPRRRSARGVTLIEIMVALGIAAFLAVTAAPYFADYTANSRLREAGNMLFAEALLAQSEAIKRNTTIRLTVNGSTVQVVDRSNPAAPVVLRERVLAAGATASGEDVDFLSDGRPKEFTEGALNIAMNGISCSADYRCPGLRVDGGGGMRLCSDSTSKSC